MQAANVARLYRRLAADLRDDTHREPDFQWSDWWPGASC